MKQQESTAVAGRPREFDVEEALEKALLLFWQKGFLGASISDLTQAMGISRPSLYAAFGNKEALLRLALERYFRGPSSYLQRALEQPTTREVASVALHGIVELIADSRTPPTCLWVRTALSCGDLSDPLAREFAKQRAEGLTALRRRFERGIAEGDLPETADAAELAQFLQTVNVGLSVQGATGASRAQLLGVVKHVLRAWPSRSGSKR